MKILYITTMYPIPKYPQQGIFCHEQVKALMQLGIDVTVAVPVPFYQKEYVSEWNFEGIKIYYIKFFKLPRAYDFHRTGISLYRSLRKKIDLSSYDLFHADAALPSGYAAMIASNRFNIPYIVHGHGLDVYLEQSYEGLYNCEKIVQTCKIVYEKANAIVGVSQKVLDCVQKRVDIRQKGYVVYNGVDTNKFVPVKGQRSETYILAVGNLIPLKGHDDTIRAFAKLIQSGMKDVRLKIVGRGYLEDNLKALAKDLNVDRYIDFLGYIPYEEVAELMRYSTLFCLPSWYEALGCVYLEAMASGVPAIGCYGNGIAEIIEDGVDGFLVEEKNSQQLYEKIKIFFEGKSYKVMAHNAREKVVKYYRWIDSAKALQQLYGEIKNDTITNEQENLYI